MASKPKATATRASTRIKTQTVPATSRTTRTGVAKTNAPPPPAPAPKKAAARKPLINRDNSPDTKPVAAPSTVSKAASIELPKDADREPIKAFLRIRPRSGDGETSSVPYLDPLSDTSVRMSDPSSSSSIYTFSHVFPPDTLQSDFFRATTLPLVRDVLEGQNGLLFTYGVTNSGKTYTIQGATAQGTAGILPRTLDVIFNSIDGLHGDGRYRPVRLQGIEAEDEAAPSSRFISPTSSPAFAEVLDDLPDDADTDPTVLKLDRNHEYTIWLSYSEVYNEKVYDLFASVNSPGATSGLPRPTSSFLQMPSSQSHPLLLTRKALTLKACPASDAEDASNAGKYVAGLRQIRVHSAAEAKALLKLGQLHRRVFGTLANSQSSRSHALVTIKVLKVHRGERDDPGSIQTSRLTLVDLAGSERTKNTQTSGDRLREAGSINKSLMVLGQCMETLRANQRAVSRSLGTAGGRVDTREVKKGLSIVPFRHSKLTEVLMDYFVGDGRAVMIVNVNPYDTGFDENAHVMRFAALAREVNTAPATSQPRVPPSPSKPKTSLAPGAHRRKVTISMGGHGRKASEAHLEVLEEDEEPADGDDGRDDEPLDPLVDALFDEIERLRTQLFDAEMRCALVEANTREEVMEEMEGRMRSMEKMYKRRLLNEAEQNEKKMDAKIDMMHQARLHSRRGRKDASESESEEVSDFEEEEVSTSVLSQAPKLSEEEETFHLTDISSGTESESDRSPSPLDTKNKGKKKVSTIRAQPARPPPVADDYSSELPDTETEDGIESDSQPQARHNSQLSSQDDIDEEEESAFPPDSASEDISEPDSPPPRKPGKSSKAGGRPYLDRAPSPVFVTDVKAAQKGKATARASTRDSTTVIPNKAARQAAVAHGAPEVEYVPDDEDVEVVKKKKRVLGKARATQETEAGSSQGKTTQLRRSARH